MRSRTLLVILAIESAACAPEPSTAPAAAAPTATASSAPLVAPAAASAPAPTASASAAPAPPATPSDVLASNRAGLDACYARARSQTPNLGRTSVEMTFNIQPDGTPLHVDLKYKHRMDDRAKECLRDAALAIHFPASMQGTQTGTIVFTPPGP